MRIEALSGWTSEQRHVVAACFLGWTLDAFDFFLLVFVLKDIAQEFNTRLPRSTARQYHRAIGPARSPSTRHRVLQNAEGRSSQRLAVA